MSEQARYARLAWWTLAGITFARVLFVLAFPFDLSGDETYYWDWGRQLAWGYFSKPPLIAWLMALAGWLGGNTDSGIRLMAVALGSGTLIFAYLLARQLWNNKVAFWAVVLMAASPGSVAINLILTIDAPLMFFWTGALYFFYNQIHNKHYRTTWTLLNTIFLGLGLLSKQMMFIFYPMAVVYLLVNAEQRHRLKDWQLWLSWVLSLAFLIPTLIWNAHNEWITVVHTQHHFAGKSMGLIAVATRVGNFFFAQLGVLSPVTGIAVLLLIIACFRRFRNLDFRARYLMVFSAPGLLVVLLMLIRQSINANWPAVFYSSILILLAAAITQMPGLPEIWKNKWEKWKYPSATTGVVFALILMLFPFILVWGQLTGSKYDRLTRLEGWSELADSVQRVREEHGNQYNDPFILTTGHRYLTSHLAFHLVDQPRVYHWPETPGRIESQYELWGFPDNLESRDAFIVVPGTEAEAPASIYQVFDSVEPLTTIQVQRGTHLTRDYTLYIGRSLKLSSSVSEAKP